jgi:putative membrane protein
MYWHDMDWWAWLPMTLGMILVWGVVAWVAIRLLVDRRDVVREPREPTAREILDARFARGAVDAAEYREARRMLETGGPAPAPDGPEDPVPGPAPRSAAPSAGPGRR